MKRVRNVRETYPYTASRVRALLSLRHDAEGWAAWKAENPPDYTAGRWSRYKELPELRRVWGITGINAGTLRVVVVPSYQAALLRAVGPQQEMMEILTFAIRTWHQWPRGVEIEQAAAAWRAENFRLEPAGDAGGPRDPASGGNPGEPNKSATPGMASNEAAPRAVAPSPDGQRPAGSHPRRTSPETSNL